MEKCDQEVMDFCAATDIAMFSPKLAGDPGQEEPGQDQHAQKEHGQEKHRQDQHG